MTIVTDCLHCPDLCQELIGNGKFCRLLCIGTNWNILRVDWGAGSIIIIPVLVYLFHIEPTLATAFSLFIVGTTSLVGGVRNALHNTVDVKSALRFAFFNAGCVFHAA